MLFKNLTYFNNVQNMYHFLFEKLQDLYNISLNKSVKITFFKAYTEKQFLKRIIKMC